CGCSFGSFRQASLTSRNRYLLLLLFIKQSLSIYLSKDVFQWKHWGLRYKDDALPQNIVLTYILAKLSYSIEIRKQFTKRRIGIAGMLLTLIPIAALSFSPIVGISTLKIAE